MTIRLLAAYKDFPNNSIVTLDAPTETGLVNAKLADTNLTGGVAYNPTLPDVTAYPLNIKTVSAAKFAQVQAAGTPSDINISYRVTETGVVWKWNILSAAFVAEGSGVGSSTVPVTAVPTSGASQALTFAASGDKAYDITLSANCTFTLTGGVAGQQQSVNLYIRQSGGGGFIPTWPAGVLWASGSAPVPNAIVGKVDVIKFTTVDGGATILGSY